MLHSMPIGRYSERNALRKASLTVLVLLATLPAASRLSAQILHADGPRPSFEVATIKPASPHETQSAMGFSDGGRGFHTTNASVRDLIQEAWNVKSTDEIENVPGWATGQKFDIEARMSDGEAASLAKLPFGERVNQVRLMLQTLLEERCELKLHSSFRENSFFLLLPAKGGPKLESAQMTAADPATKAAAHPAVGPRIQWKGPGVVEAAGVSMPMLTEFLSRQPELGFDGGFTLGDLVVDKTGLTGSFDWTLTWQPESDPDGDTTGNANRPTFFTALREQLGLELKRTKGQVEVLVIDHVSRPSPD
jgi:bla regulator protein blaR1